MKAVYLNEHGERDVLQYGDLPEPELPADHVMIEVKACALNHLDLWMRRGIPGYRFIYPFILGSDIAGVVHAAGSAARGLNKGDRVLVNPGVSCGHCEACLAGRDNFCKDYGIIGEHRSGGYAQYVCVPRANILPFPAEMSFEQAACIPLVYLTAWQMVVDKLQIKPGDVILVQAAGSGVSSAAIQIAKLHGATVYATSGSDEKCRKAMELGADACINYNTEDVARRVKELTGKRGVDAVVEHVGGQVFESSLKCLRWGGRVVTCGATTGFSVDLDLRHVFFKQTEILGSTMGSKGELFRIIRMVEAGKLKPVLDRVLPLHEAREAHRLLEERAAFGKIVLVPG
ncbi:MAG: alcohol dehydrogenase [Myxococcota bacterium]|nr:alcohol dehydrogenase [Myxococcota bacterium]